MNAHTPGPWRAAIDEWSHKMGESSVPLACIESETFDAIDVFAPIHQVSHAQHVANALLVAAAPDMLMALQMLYDETADYIRLNNLGGMDNHCMRLAREALAKALGASAASKRQRLHRSLDGMNEEPQQPRKAMTPDQREPTALRAALEECITALEAINLKEEQIMGGQANHLILRMPMDAIAKCAAALKSARAALALQQEPKP